MKRLVFFVVLLVFLWADPSHSKRLNYPRVLLPVFDELSVNFTLEVIEKGCFQWKVNRPDLLRITPIYEDDADECSYRAVVSPVLNREKVRNTPLVLAEETTSGEVLRCDVILDVIHSFKVITTTRELFLQEAPEKFELMAHDVFGNAFSTLQDVQFHWEIIQHSRSDHYTDVLRYLKFSESTYHEVPEVMQRLESEGVNGFMILLEGINTGTAKVSVRLPYAEYKNVPSVEVDIMVLANILIDPNDVNILVGDRTRFRVLQLTKGTLNDISSNSQYFLEMEKENVARMVNHLATGLELGKSLVLLRDKNVASDVQANDGSCPKATLSVVEPGKLTVDLLPHHNWVTVEGEFHDIVFTLVTKDEQRIIMGDAYHIDSTIDGKYYRVDSQTKNGTHNFGQTLKVGKSVVRGEFEGLAVEMELQIYKRIELTPKLVIIPFEPVQNVRPNRIQFLAGGGDGNFAWSVDNKNLVTVNKNGLAEARITEHTVGEHSRKATVKVALQRNPKIYETASILFLEPIKLEIVDYNFETALGDVVQLQVALYAEQSPGQLVPFTDCRNVNFELVLSEASVFKQEAAAENVTLAGNACQLVTLRAVHLGRSQLKVNYRYQEHVLSDSVQLVVFEPLELLNPTVAELVLPVGSSQNVLFMNGPEKLFNIDAELTKTVKYEKGIIEVTEFNAAQATATFNLNVFTVLCKKVGESEFHLKLTNVLGGNSKRYRPYYFQHSTLRVFCVKPRFLNLISRAKMNEACPINSKVSSIMELNEKDKEKDFVEVEIEVLDVNNRKLSNISSLALTWKLLEGGQTEMSEFHYTRAEEQQLVENIAVPGAFLLNVDKNLKAEMKTNFKLLGTVVGYDDTVMRSVRVSGEVPAFGIQRAAGESLVTPVIESELNFMVVNATLLSADRITIFFKSTRRVQILQGSGYYEVSLSDRSKVTTEVDRQKNEILIKPREIGDTIMTVADRCLSSLKQEVLVSVVSVDRIELRVSDRVELSKNIDAIVRLYSHNDVLDIDYENLGTYELEVNVLNGEILTMELVDDQRHLQRGEIRYRITGHVVGDTKVVVSSGKTVKSSPASSIQVFAPLELFPKNSTILVGTSLQINYRGGPQPDVGVTFEAVDEKVLTIDSALVHGSRIGNSRVIGRCVAFDPSAGAAVTFSQDFVHVHVVPLEGVKIVAPLVKMVEGAVMPASIWALPNIPPSVLGTLANLRVHWSTNRVDVLEISSVFAAIGVEYQDVDLINVRVRGLKAGKAQLNAKVIAPNGKTFHSSVEITVVPDLELVRPKRMTAAGSVLTMPPNSEIQLKANIDDVQFKLNNPAAALTGRNLINVTESGAVTSGDQIGFAFVMATSAASFEQELPIVLRVKNIHYIMASLHVAGSSAEAAAGHANLRIGEARIPRGLTVQLKISLHDNMGNEILHNWDANEHLGYAVARRDGLSVHIDADFKLMVALLDETSNILTVSLRGLKSNVKYAEDYVKLSVAQSANTFPTAKEILSTGDVVCFDSLLSMAGGGGSAAGTTKWTSSDSRVIQVNDKTGVAVVHSVPAGEPQQSSNSRRVQVTNQDAVTAIKFDVDVRQADSVEFVRVAENFNGREWNGEHRAYAVIKNRLQGAAKLSNLIARNVTRCVYRLRSDVEAGTVFSCHILRESNNNAVAVPDKLLGRITVRSGFSARQGQYYCGVTLTDYDQEWVPYLRKNSPTLLVELRLTNGVMSTAELKVVAGIHVPVDRIRFAKESDAPEFTVIGREVLLKDLRVVGSHKHLEVKKMSTSSTGQESEFVIRYQVKIVGSVDDVNVLSVTVDSPATEQVVTLPVEWPNANMMCSSKPFSVDNLFSSVFSLGVIISTVIVTLTFVYMLLWCSSSSSKTYTNTQAFQQQQNGSRSSSQKSSPLNGSHNQSGNFITQQHSITSPPSPSAGGAGGGGGTFNTSSMFNQSNSPLSPIYGDTGGSPISPHRRVNPRFM